VEGISDLLLQALNMSGRVPRFEPRIQQALEQRLLGPLFMMTGAIALAGGARHSLEVRAQALKAAFQTVYDAGFGGLQLEPWLWRAAPNTAPSELTSPLQTLVLSAAEIASLWHPPSDRVLTPGV